MARKKNLIENPFWDNFINKYYLDFKEFKAIFYESINVAQTVI